MHFNQDTDIRIIYRMVMHSHLESTFTLQECNQYCVHNNYYTNQISLNMSNRLVVAIEKVPVCRQLYSYPLRRATFQVMHEGGNLSFISFCLFPIQLELLQVFCNVRITELHSYILSNLETFNVLVSSSYSKLITRFSAVLTYIYTQYSCVVTFLYRDLALHVASYLCF